MSKAPPRAVHFVFTALPDTSGYTLRTQRLLSYRDDADASPADVIVYPREKWLPPGDCTLHPRIATYVHDGVAYHALTAPPHRRPLIAATRWLDDRGIRGTSRIGFRQPLGPIVPHELSDLLAERIRAADVVHAHSPPRCGLWALETARKYGRPFVYEVRGFLDLTAASEGRQHVWDRPIEEYREQERRLLREADAIVTLSRVMAEEVVRRGGPADRIGVVPNAATVDLSVLDRRDAALRESTVRRKLGIADSFVVGTITNVREMEGIDTLIDAVRLLRDEGVPAVALIVGDGRDIDSVREQAAAANAVHEGCVLLPGRVPPSESDDYYTALDVFAIPRNDVPVGRLVAPVKPVQALKLAVPVAASDLPALRDFCGDGAVYAAPESAASLADVLRRFHASGDFRRETAAAGLRHLQAQSSEALAARELTATYEQAIAHAASVSR